VGRPSGQAWFLGEHRPDALLGAQPGDSVLASGDPASWESIGDEAVSERGVVAVDVAGRVDQMGILPVTL
jgi:hypothetical protein